MQFKRQGLIKKKDSFDDTITNKENIEDKEGFIDYELETSSKDSSSSTSLGRARADRKTAIADSPYADKIAEKLGNRSKLLGLSAPKRKDGVNGVTNDETSESDKPKATLGRTSDTSTENAKKTSPLRLSMDVDEFPTYMDDDDLEDDHGDESSYDIEVEEETDLVKLVERKLLEKMQKEAEERDVLLLTQSLNSNSKESTDATTPEALGLDMGTSMTWKYNNVINKDKNNTLLVKTSINRTTSGIGGTWSQDEATEVETYRPSRGSWGYFPRPKDISRAYGGGKEVGASVRSTLEDEIRKKESEENTRELLRNYREKAGIDVQSEKDNAQEINEALAIGQRAMQVGIIISNGM